MRYSLAFVLMVSLVLLSACAPKEPQLEDARSIWPLEFYEKLNLRSFFNYYTPYVKTYCNTYPKDFFSREQVLMPDTQSVVMENSAVRLSIHVDEFGKLIMHNESKQSKAWDKKTISVYYDEEHDDYRVNEIYIKPKPKCLYLLPKEDENSSLEGEIP